MGTRVAQKPASWLEQGTRAVRRLPHRWARYLIMLDMLLAVIPPWGYFFFSRWKGRVLGPVEFVRLYAGSVRFIWAHLWHNAGDGVKTGAFFVDWSSPPARRTLGVERPDWQAKGACGTCQKCCSTTWLPEGKQASCPFLGERGCTVYGGLYWDYFNCGRYPVHPEQVAYYECPRFVGVFDRPKPAARPAAPERPRLPLVAASAPVRPVAARVLQPVGDAPEIALVAAGSSLAGAVAAPSPH